MSSPPANFFAKFSAFFSFSTGSPQLFWAGCTDFLSVFGVFYKGNSAGCPSVPEQDGILRTSVAFPQANADQQAQAEDMLSAIMHELGYARFLSVFALHSFRRFPRGNFVEFIKFSTIGVDFPQMMWYTIILRIPVERQVESLRKTVFHNHCSAEFACPADHGDPRRSCRTGFEVT